MAQLLLVDDDPGTLTGFSTILRLAGHSVITASLGRQTLDVLDRERVDLVLADLRLPDMTAVDILRELRQRRAAIPFVVVTGFGSTRDIVEAMRLGAADFVEKPLLDDDLLQVVDSVLGSPHVVEAYAAARWARAVVSVIDAPTDSRSLREWSRLAFASPGTLRNWCRTAGISPRRSLVFARLLRAVVFGHGGRRKPENLLDVDRRTLVGLLRLAGLNPAHELPRTVGEFLHRQTLVCDHDALREIRRAIDARSQYTPI